MDGVAGAHLCEVVGCDTEEFTWATTFGGEFENGDGDGDVVGLTEGGAGDGVLADAHGGEEGEEGGEGDIDFGVELEDVKDAEVFVEDLVAVVFEKDF